MSRKTYPWLATLTLLAVLTGACAAPAATQAPAVPTEAMAAPTTVPAATAEPAAPAGAGASDDLALPAVDPAAVSGNLVLAGSSTVYPLAERLAERFQAEGFTGETTIDSVGTGGGFERFCTAGETDIANASRPIKAEEIAACEAIGRTPLEFRVGTDALAVVVSSENDFLTDVTLAELAQIFSAGVTQWREIRPEWPAEDIQRFSPGTDSGTFDYFVEAVMDPAYPAEDAGAAALLAAANTQFSEDDNVLVQGVEGSPYAIGYFGFAYYQENQGRLKALSIDGVTPTAETAESNTYPLSRPLFIYSDAGVMAEKPQVAAFINFFLTYVNEEIETVGYFPAGAASLNTAKQAWLSAQGE
jgi:phosphate binding protein